MRGLWFCALFFLLLGTAMAKGTCDYGIEIIANGTEFKSQEFQWKMKASKLDGTATNITGKARIENSAGDLVKEYSPLDPEPISRQKTSSSYSPNLEEGEYKLIAEIEVECSDSDSSNNVDTKMFKIKDDNGEAENVDEPVDKGIKEIKKYTGSAEVTEEKIIKNDEVPSQLPESSETIKNDSEHYDTGQIKNTSTQEKRTPVGMPITGNAEKTLTDEDDCDFRETDVYESSNEKSKALVLPLILFISIMINAVLIWKR